MTLTHTWKMTGNPSKWLVSVGLLISMLMASGCSTPSGEQDAIKIGAVLPLSGPSAQYGTWIREALEVAREDVNSGGGIQGRQLEIIYEDDQAQPRVATTAMEKLVNVDKVPLVYGSWASSCVLAQAPIAEKAHVVLVAEAIAPAIRNAGEYVFRTQPDASVYVKELVKAIPAKLKVQRSAILYVNNDFGLAQADLFEKLLKEKGGTVVGREAFSQGATEFKAELTKLVAATPDTIFVPGYTEVGILLRQARELGLKQQFIASVPFENPAIVKAAGGAAEGVIFPHHFVTDLDNPLMRKYQATYKAKYGRPSEGFAALAYDGLKIIASVMSSAGTSPDRIRDGLAKTREFPGVTGPCGFDSAGDIEKPIFLKTVRNGEFVRWE